MNPIRRELLNGLFVLVLSCLLSAAFAAFQVSFNLQLWVLILIGVGVAVTGYVMFEIALGYMASTERREKEWLKRVGTPARLELFQEGESAGLSAVAEAVKAMRPGSDYTVMYYFDSEGGLYDPRGGAERADLTAARARREKTFSAVVERLKRGTIREHKRIICFDHHVLAKDHELKSGVLRVGRGPGTIDRAMGEHCRLLLETKGCSVYVAPAVLRSVVLLFGVDKAAMTVEAAEQHTGRRMTAGFLFFSDPPNGEIIEQLRQMERETERRMVAVHKIVFPEDAEPRAELATR
jgi:hypothetical protein